ncbi:cation-transporting ATPase like protein [Verticillium longisporum]|uniref:Cation-transporting ATPase like protein n=1 Tax=Verticillium longisporum TaxID=100787 RepID=A0A8I2Z942_VERLO|nr:cation-transporting ATPase like protein [Verticillium longisporum]
MLTGESVPVSKTPATEEALQQMDLGAPTVSLEIPSGFKFYRDSFRYVGVMAMVAMLGFVVSLINFIRLDLAWHLIIVRALDVITIAVPPALPATLSIEDGLDILGVRVASGGRFSDIMGDVATLYKAINEDLKSSFAAALFTMATCHSLRVVDDQLSSLSPSVARPPVEYQQYLGTTDTRTNSAVELGVLRSFEFVSQLRRASVIVRRFGQQSGDIYVKGAPECMRDICREESFPSDYEEQLAYYTHKGYRVIGCATRHIPKLNWVKVQKMKRDQVESDLDFVGFIVFENKLKPTTTSVLRELHESNIGAVMCTGDNILTAISVGRECGLVDKTAHCFVSRFVEGHPWDPNSRLLWESIDDSSLRLDEYTLLPLPASQDVDVSLPYNITNLRNYSLAISGDAFRWLVDFAEPHVLHRMLVNGKIYARMSPDEKHELVEKLQSIDYCVGFCGDGANDCGALKAADVGISLSEAEASVAAPFTSRNFDIACCPEVIREGRAALVTSFSCFKYMSLYSAIQFTSVSFLYATASNLGDFQFLFIDLLLILPIAIFMGWAGPYPVLYKKRPTANLVSRKVLIPLLGQMIICIAIQATVYIAVREQPWYIPPKVRHDKSNIKNSENTVLFLVSCFEYILAGVVLNAGPPFRQKALKNWPFLATIATTLLLTLYMIMSPAHWVAHLMQLTSTSGDFQLFLVGLARAVGRLKQRLTRQPKKRKLYKTILEEMRIDSLSTV